MNGSTFKPYLYIILIGAALFFPFLGSVPLFDWDEANFSEAAREMLVADTYSRVFIDYMPFWEKPPIFIWMQALCMKLFGANEWGARMPNAIIGIITLCSLYFIGNKVSQQRLGKWWVGLYIASWLPHFYFKTAIIDPSFNLFIFWAVYHLYALQNSAKSIQHSVLSGVFLGIAVLTKGPAAILICVLTLLVYLILSRFKTTISWKHIGVLTLACCLTTFSWFGIDILQNGWWFTNEFITYQIRLFSTEDAGHGGPFFYHWIVLLIGCFPAAIFLFQYLHKQKHILVVAQERNFSLLMWALFGVVLVLFSIVKTKIVHYSSLCYMPLTFLAARQLQWWWEGKKTVWSLTKWMLFIIGGLICAAIALLPVVGSNISQLAPYIRDTFTQGNLQAQVSWYYWETVFGILGIVGLIIAWKEMQVNTLKGFKILVFSQALLIFVTMVLFVPRIERYSQGAAIDFYKQAAEENAYIHPLGFKSYAYLFYSNKMPVQDSVYYQDRTHYLLNASLDKKVYFVSKNIYEKEALKLYNLVKIQEKNGYVLYGRKDQIAP